MRSPRPPLVLLAAVALVTVLALGHTAEIRVRAESALSDGMPRREAQLARGFVLGEDEGIDRRTVDDFRRSGLSHLLAVSGQNVALLALLALPLLALLGIPLRLRLVWVLALIAVYVPLAGAGPSIVRAGVMGALSVIATLAGRRSFRLHALAIAAGVTLAIEPRIGSDVGWQLSFAAVLGILLLAAPLRRAIAGRIGTGRLRRTLAEAAAMTVAATVATAPLIAFHFGAVSTTTLLANLLALPAVAPAMWLGMISAAIGQVPGIPAAPLNALNAPLLAYIAEVAALTGRPSWAYLEVEIGAAGLAASYLLIGAAAILAPGLFRARRLAGIRRGRRTCQRRWRGRRQSGSEPRRAIAAIAAAVLLAALLIAPSGRSGGEAPGPPAGGLRVSVLDVGQGDSILLQPAGAAPVLVDTGPPGSGLREELEQAGVGRLGAVVITHDQSDHAGGIAELLGVVPIGEVMHATLGPETAGLIDAAGVRRRPIRAGATVRAGRLRLEVLWPPVGTAAPGSDPNAASLVMVAHWHRFAMLLCADAEAESVPIEPGPIDVLKVAHHGSEDAGLDALIARSRPRIAVISAGEDNPFGHPSPATLATLARDGVRTLRTDREGTISLDIDRRAASLRLEP